MLMLMCLMVPVAVYCTDTGSSHVIITPIKSTHVLSKTLHNNDSKISLVENKMLVNFFWDASNFYPDPNVANRTVCGMSNVPSTKNNSVCNPDAIVNADEALRLNDQILEIRRKAPCQCGSQCGSNGLDGHFNIALVMVKNLISHTTYTNHCPTDMCRVFATELRAVTWFPWLQVCDDGMVIAYSNGNSETGNRAIFTSTGPKARSKISDECIDKIWGQVNQLCMEEKFYECFSEMLVYYENALTGGACGQRSGGTSLSTGEIVGIVFGVIFGIALIAGMISCCVGYCRGWDCVVGTCLGGLCKCFMGLWQTIINILFIRFCCSLCGVEPLSCVEE